MKTANAFTLTRVVLAPVFFVVYFIPIWTGQFAGISASVLIPLLAFMEFTDFLDGYFARRHKEVSDFGKMFDPFADVMVHLTTFTCFMTSYGPDIGRYLPPVIFILIVYREFGMNFIRMVAAKKGTAIAARKGGKLKTVFYVASGFVCLIPECAVRLYYVKPGMTADFVTGQGIIANLVTVVVQNYPAWKTAALVMFIASLLLCYVSFIDYLVHFKSLLTNEKNKK
ncbi:MAG TPA: CDP-diacylglycerol--glycerol-3-phosphate 3-phosphatidyltransferase [Treponema sp.]|nr:CDP-diacylglycerol--glycerol-3-phosphate 3-phosphatidyltransferase [Treponema sp.]